MSRNPDIESTGNAVAITPNNSTTFAVTRGIYVGASGNVQVDMAENGGPIVFTSLAAGVIHPIAVTRIYATNTTATNIIAVY